LPGSSKIIYSLIFVCSSKAVEASETDNGLWNKELSLFMRNESKIKSQMNAETLLPSTQTAFARFSYPASDIFDATIRVVVNGKPFG
jgi:hypothetical protein